MVLRSVPFPHVNAARGPPIMTSQRGHGVKHSKSTAALYGHTYMATEFHLDLDCVVIADAISSLSEIFFFNNFDIAWFKSFFKKK